MATEEGEKPNSKTALLTTIFGGSDQTIKLITLVLIAITGGGNFFATKQTARATDQEVATAIREIHDLHEQLTASIERQKEMHDILDKMSKEKSNGP